MLGLLFQFPLSMEAPAQDAVNARKEEEERQRTMISAERARKEWQYEQYRVQKQIMLDNLRNKQIAEAAAKKREALEREANAPKARPEPEPAVETVQERFLKERLWRTTLEQEETADETMIQRPQGGTSRVSVEEIEKPFEPAVAKIESLAEQEMKENHFYQLKLLVDYRSAQQILLKEKRQGKTQEIVEKGAGARPAREAALDDVSFIREVSLNPYALQSQDWERE